MLDALPTQPGVYYFINQYQKIIYVGKAKNLLKRVKSHFANNKTSKQKQEFLRHIYHIQHQICTSEWTAELLESIEIKRLWPAFNKSQKHYEHKFAIYQFTDAKGYLRLCIDKKRNNLQPLMQFNLLTQAYNTLWQWVNNFQLHPALCFLDQSQKHITNLPPAHTHNLAIQSAVEHHLQSQQSYLIHSNNHFYILVCKGIFKGMGYLNTQIPQWNRLSTILSQITLYPDNSVIQGLLLRYEQQNPQQILPIIDDTTATRQPF